MHRWLEGRRELNKAWGVKMDAKLHSNELCRRGAGRFCETHEQEVAFRNWDRRLTAYDIMLDALAGCEPLVVASVCGNSTSLPKIYEVFVAVLQEWAMRCQTHVLVYLDGMPRLLDRDTADVSTDQIVKNADEAYRKAAPFRRVHQELELAARRVIEEPVVLNSRSNQLIQAADLVAYGAYHHMLDARPEIWPKRNPRSPRVLESYKRLRRLWIPGGDHGVIWSGF